MTHIFILPCCRPLGLAVLVVITLKNSNYSPRVIFNKLSLLPIFLATNMVTSFRF